MHDSGYAELLKPFYPSYFYLCLSECSTVVIKFDWKVVETYWEHNLLKRFLKVRHFKMKTKVT